MFNFLQVCDSCGIPYAKCSQCINGDKLSCQCPCYCEVDFDQCSSQFDDTNSTNFPHSACYCTCYFYICSKRGVPKYIHLASCKFGYGMMFGFTIIYLYISFFLTKLENRKLNLLKYRNLSNH